MLWIGTSGGLSRYRDGLFTTFGPPRASSTTWCSRSSRTGRASSGWAETGGSRGSPSRAGGGGRGARRPRAPSSPTAGPTACERRVQRGRPARELAGQGRRLYFPTAQGLVVVDPAHMPRNTVPRPCRSRRWWWTANPRGLRDPARPAALRVPLHRPELPRSAQGAVPLPPRGVRPRVDRGGIAAHRLLHAPAPRRLHLPGEGLQQRRGLERGGRRPPGRGPAVLLGDRRFGPWSRWASSARGGPPTPSGCAASSTRVANSKAWWRRAPATSSWRRSAPRRRGRRPSASAWRRSGRSEIAQEADR